MEGQGLTQRLKEALEVLSGFRGKRDDHAVRFSDLDPYLRAITSAQQNFNVMVGDIRSARERADEAFDQHEDTLLEADERIAAVRAEVIAAYGDIDPDTPLSQRVDEAFARIEETIPIIATTDSAIDAVFEGLAELQAARLRTDEYLADAGVYVDQATGSVNIQGVNETNDRIGIVEIRASALEAEITLRATQAYVDGAISEAVLDPTQIPVLDDVNLRLTSAETRLDGAEAELTSVASALTVEGAFVQMTDVRLELDGLAEDIALAITDAEFDPLETRVNAAELTLSTLGDVSTLTATVSSSRELFRRDEDDAEQSIADLMEGYRAREAIREGNATATFDLRTQVTEEFAAEASARLALIADLETTKGVISEIQTLDLTAETAFAQRLGEIISDLDPAAGGSVAARLNTVEQTSVDAETAGAIAATRIEAALEPEGDIETAIGAGIEPVAGTVEDILALDLTPDSAFGLFLQEIVSTFGDTSSFVTQSATAYAGIDGLSSTYVLRQQAGAATGYLEAVASDNPDGLPLSTFRLSYDYIDLVGKVSLQDLTVVDAGGGNLLPNGSLRFGDTRGWATVASTMSVAAKTDTGNAALTGAPRPFVLAVAADAALQEAILCDPFPVGDGDELSLSIRHAASGGASATFLYRVIWYDIDGVAMTPRNEDQIGGTRTTTDWQRQYLGVTAPAGAVRADVRLIRQAGGSGTLYVADMGLYYRDDAAVRITPYSITAPMMAVDSLSAITANIGTFRSAASGERIEIEDDRITVYDDSGAVRVKIGNLA